MSVHVSAAPPLSVVEDVFTGEDGSLQFLLEEWDTVSEVFG
jgi:hypothetical protein